MQLVGIQIYNLDIARIKKQYKELNTNIICDTFLWCNKDLACCICLNIISETQDYRKDELPILVFNLL